MVGAHGDLRRSYCCRSDANGGALHRGTGRCRPHGISFALRELPSAGTRRTQRGGGTRRVELHPRLGRPHHKRPARVHSIDHAAGRSWESGRRELPESRRVPPLCQWRACGQSAAHCGQSRLDWLGRHRADACGPPKDSREHHGRCAGGPAGSQAHGTAGDGPSPELRAGHRPDAPQSRSRRLAHDPAQLSGSQLQSTGLDYHRERKGSAPGVGVGHERRRSQRADAHRAQRHHLSRQHK